MYFNKLGHVSKKNVTSSLYMKRNRLMAQWGRLCRAQWDVLSHTLYINHGLCVVDDTFSEVKRKSSSCVPVGIHTHTYTQQRHDTRLEITHVLAGISMHYTHTNIHTKCLQQQQVHSTLLLPLRSTQPFTLNQLFIQICFWQSSHTT